MSAYLYTNLGSGVSTGTMAKAGGYFQMLRWKGG